MEPLIPLFWTFGDIYSGFQSQDGFLVCFLVCMILRFTSGVIPAHCFEVNIVAEPFQSTYLQMRCVHKQKLNASALNNFCNGNKEGGGETFGFFLFQHKSDISVQY